MRQLWIAEKPSAARDMAAALSPGATKPAKTHILAGNLTFTWMIGHMLETANPEDYDMGYKDWQFSDLPIVPKQWKLKPRHGTRDQINAIAALIKSHDEIVHAGDTGREGQLIIDELLEWLNCGKPVLRVLISNLNPGPITDAARNLQPNSNFTALSLSARARQRADWLIGINGTRAYSLKTRWGRVPTSVGRVQTPTLALIVNRDREIEDFVAGKFYVVSAVMDAESGRARATWQPGEAYAHLLDDENRLLDKNVANALVADLTGTTGSVTLAEYKKGKTLPPLPFSLSELQSRVLARRHIRARPDDVLAACQALYEERKLITYPRTDCAYLPTEHHPNAATLIDKLADAPLPDNLKDMANAADAALRSRAFNDSKTGEHHAMVPTGEQLHSVPALSPLESTCFELITRNYLAQFFPAQQHTTLTAEFNLSGELFKCRTKSITDQGYARFFANDAAASDTNTDEENESLADRLPRFTEGEPVVAEAFRVDDKTTAPPRHFTGSTLIKAMSNIARFVSDPDERAILRETDGIGTEATRSDIINTLFKREYIVERGKSYLATEKGRRLIDIVTPRLKSASETALWESHLNRIAETGNSTDFNQNILRLAQHIIDQARTLPDPPRRSADPGYDLPCPVCGKRMYYRSNNQYEFFGCSAYPECNATIETENVHDEILRTARQQHREWLKARADSPSSQPNRKRRSRRRRGNTSTRPRR